MTLRIGRMNFSRRLPSYFVMCLRISSHNVVQYFGIRIGFIEAR